MAKKLLLTIILLHAFTLHGIKNNNANLAARDLKRSKLSRTTKALLIQAHEDNASPLYNEKTTTLEKRFNTASDHNKKLDAAEQLFGYFGQIKDTENELRWLITAFNLGSHKAAENLERYYHDKDKQVAAIFSLFSAILGDKYILPAFSIKESDSYYNLKDEVNEAIGQKNNRRLCRALNAFENSLQIIPIYLPVDKGKIIIEIAKLRELSPPTPLLFPCQTTKWLNPKIDTSRARMETFLTPIEVNLPL